MMINLQTRIRDEIKIAFEEYSIKQDLECEKYIFENADGIIHRYKQSVFVDYAKRYKNNGKILEFQQYPLGGLSFNTKSNDKNQNKTDRFALDEKVDSVIISLDDIICAFYIFVVWIQNYI